MMSPPPPSLLSKAEELNNSIDDEEVEDFSRSLRRLLDKSPNRQPIRILSNPLSRLHSWDQCYCFFQKNWNTLCKSSENDEIFDQGCLQLAFYLASFGMYRGKSSLLQCSNEIFRRPLFQIFSYINSSSLNLDEILVSSRAILEIDRRFTVNLTAALRKAALTPRITCLLRQKFLLGIFGACPAFDVNAKKTLKQIEGMFPERIKGYLSGLSKHFDEQDVANLCALNELLRKSRFIRDLEPISIDCFEFPCVRKLDLILWHQEKSEDL